MFFEFVYADRKIKNTSQFEEHTRRSYTSIPNCMGMVVFEIKRTNYDIKRAVSIYKNRKLIGCYSVAEDYGGKNDDSWFEKLKVG